MMRSQPDQQSKLLYELSTLIFNILQSPMTLFEFADQSLVMQRSTQLPPVRSMQQITPAGFASLLLGISMALMLCGSVTFFIGFFMMPWILVLVMVLYLAGIVSTLSVIGQAIFSPMPSSQSHVQHWLKPSQNSYKGRRGLAGEIWTEMNVFMEMDVKILFPDRRKSRSL